MLGQLDLILAELLAIYPLPLYPSDENLWEMVKNKDFSKFSTFHFKLIKFGKIIEEPSKIPNYSTPVKKIEFFIDGKCYKRNLSDLCYKLTDSYDNITSSRIITPWYFHDYSTYLNLDNIPDFLENKECLLLYSLPGKNKYNKIVNSWTLVQLKDNLKENAGYLREYICKGQELAIYKLIKAPNAFFDFEVPEYLKSSFLHFLDEELQERIYEAIRNSGQKTLSPETLRRREEKRMA